MSIARPNKKIPLALHLGLLSDQAIVILDDAEGPVNPSAKKVLAELGGCIRLLYLMNPSDLAIATPGFHQLSTGGLKDEVQRCAHQEARMASSMAERVVAILSALATGNRVSDRGREDTKIFLRFLSEGSLRYVDGLQGKRDVLRP